MSPHRIVLLGSTLVFYVLIVVAVINTTFLVRLDWQLMFFRPYQQWPEVHAFIDYYVVLGQRGPTAVMVLAWLGWRSWRQHTLRPLLMLGTSLLLLNVTVGAAKIGMGRLGPHYATQIGANEMWHFGAGDIFPSGHTANAVVTWGILAYLASSQRARRYLSATSAIVALGVGLSTVYLGTHWLSDVLLGWAAGLLILLALPWFEPLAARAEARIFALRERVREHRAVGAPVPSGATAVLAQRTTAEDEAPTPVPEPVTAVRHPVRAHRGHTARPERTAAAPAGGRRPQHPERASRPAPASPVTGG